MRPRLLTGDPADNCQEVGQPTAWAMGNDPLSAKNSLRNKAADMGATHVRMETIEQSSAGDTQAHGTAFRCP